MAQSTEFSKTELENLGFHSSKVSVRRDKGFVKHGRSASGRSYSVVKVTCSLCGGADLGFEGRTTNAGEVFAGAHLVDVHGITEF